LVGGRERGNMDHSVKWLNNAHGFQHLSAAGCPNDD